MFLDQIRKNKEVVDEYQEMRKKFNSYNDEIDGIIENRQSYFEDIKDNEGIKKIEELQKECLEKEKSDEIVEECTELFRIAIRQMIKDRKRISIGEQITIKEDSVYEYNSRDRSKANMKHIIGRNKRNKFRICNEIRDKDARMRFIEAIELFEKIEPIIRSNKIRVDEKIEGVNNLRVYLSSNKVEIELSGSRNKDIVFSTKDLKRNTTDHKRLDDKYMISILMYREEIVECLEKFNERIDEKIKERQDIKGKIRNLLKKEMVMDGF